ncbi:MAG: AAA family ATPase [Thermoplasmata archaeon]
MGKTIAVSGKGGVGKSTFATLLIKALSEKSVILAVDADPNSTLGSMLGVKVDQTIGDLREDMLKNVGDLPPGMSKQELVDYNLRMAMVESDKIDLITMGRQEGPGCYCYINNILRTYIDTLSANYDFVIIDNEAGMEHLSRRTTRDVDMMFILTDPTKHGVVTAGRIRGMSENLDLRVKDRCLIITRIADIPEPLSPVIEEAGFDCREVVPEDQHILDLSLTGDPLIDIPVDSVAYGRAKEILAKLNI